MTAQCRIQIQDEQRCLGTVIGSRDQLRQLGLEGVAVGDLRQKIMGRQILQFNFRLLKTRHLFPLRKLSPDTRRSMHKSLL